MKPFTLTMLGTDTKYTPTLKVKKDKTEQKKKEKSVDYPKGESLSIVTSKIKYTEDYGVEKDSSVALSTNHVACINGPKTSGADVNDRIGRGVALLLKAISRGHTSLVLLAHSRGAVESKIIAHEIDAAKQLIGQCTSLEDLIKELTKQQTSRAKTSNTGDIIAALKAELNTKPKPDAEFWNNLKTHLPSADTNIKLFGIDPVPGDITLSSWSPITWLDERFKKLASIIKIAEFLYYENETTNVGFTPLLSAFDPLIQLVKLMNHFGHHGTGSAGNNLSQTGVNVSPPGTKTTHVQKLFIFKMHEFLTTNGVELEDFDDLYNEGRALGRSYVVKKPNGEFDYPAIYLKLYSKILKNKAAYAAYNKTNYSGFDRFSSERSIIRDGKYEEFKKVFNLNTGYVNEEHGQLMRQYFSSVLGIKSEKQPLNDMLGLVSKRIVHIVKKLAEAEDKVEEASSSNKDVPRSDLAQSYLASKTLFQNSQVCKDFISIFESMVANVSEEYISNDWSQENKNADKINMYHFILDLVKNLHESKKTLDPKLQPLVDQMLASIETSLKTAIDIQYNRFKAELVRLGNVPQDTEKAYFNLLALNLKGIQDLTQEDANVTAIFANPKVHSFASLDQKFAFVRTELANSLTPVLKDKLDKEYPAERLVTEYQQMYGDDFAKYKRIFAQTQIFLEDLNSLSQNFKHLKPDFECQECELRHLFPAFIDTAARRFYTKKAIENRATLISEDFQGQVERCAVAKYQAVDPMVTLQARLDTAIKARNDLNLELNSLSDIRDRIAAENASLKNQQTTHLNTIEQLQRVQNGLQQQYKDSESHREGLIKTVKKLTEDKNSAEARCLELQAQVQARDEQITLLKTAVETNNLQAHGLQNQLSEQQSIVNNLKAQICEYALANDANIASVSQINARFQALQNQNTQQTQVIGALQDQLAAAQEQNAKHVDDKNRLVQIKDRLIRKLMTLVGLKGTQATKIKENAEQIANLMTRLTKAENSLRVMQDNANQHLLDKQNTENRLYKQLQKNQREARKIVLLKNKITTVKTRSEELSIEKDQLDVRLQEMRLQNANLQKELVNAREQMDDLSNRAEAQANRLNDVTQQHLAAREQLEEARAREADLTLEANRLNVQLNASGATVSHLLDNVDEAKNLLLIKDKLLPIAKKYHSSLSARTSEDQEELKKIQDKMARVQLLIDCLEKPNTLASVRVKDFYVLLNQHETELGAHRDLEWKRFCRNALFAGLALITGILPALIALLIYVNVGETSGKSMMFWRSTGENIVNELKNPSVQLG